MRARRTCGPSNYIRSDSATYRELHRENGVHSGQAVALGHGGHSNSPGTPCLSSACPIPLRVGSRWTTSVHLSEVASFLKEHDLLYRPIFACTEQRLQLRLSQPMPKRTDGTMRRFRRSPALSEWLRLSFTRRPTSIPLHSRLGSTQKRLTKLRAYHPQLSKKAAQLARSKNLRTK